MYIVVPQVLIAVSVFYVQILRCCYFEEWVFKYGQGSDYLIMLEECLSSLQLSENRVIQFVPPTDGLLLAYVDFLRKKELSHATIEAYVCSVASTCNEMHKSIKFSPQLKARMKKFSKEDATRSSSSFDMAEDLVKL